LKLENLYTSRNTNFGPTRNCLQRSTQTSMATNAIQIVTRSFQLARVAPRDESTFAEYTGRQHQIDIHQTIQGTTASTGLGWLRSTMFGVARIRWGLPLTSLSEMRWPPHGTIKYGVSIPQAPDPVGTSIRDVDRVIIPKSVDPPAI
jgi:hypothetical protein